MSTIPPKLPDYARWSARNPEQNYSLYDYAYGVFKTQSLSADLLVAVLKLCWPVFVEHCGGVFLEEQFIADKASEMLEQGRSCKDVELWQNMFCVDGLLDGIPDESDEHICDIAELLRAAWSSKLEKDYPQRDFEVELFKDEDTGDTCVTFYQHTNASP